MATYAAGDIQGCFDELQALLKKIDFDFECDSLWLTGDIINRGPQSLETLRFVKSLGDRAITVLGNHDLHLLAVVFGNAELKSSDTLDEILAAPDCLELCHWLRNQPVLHHDAKLGFTMAHAGVFPLWDLTKAQQCAHELEQVLRGDAYVAFLDDMYGNQPAEWSDSLQGISRLRFITNAFTRMRYCSIDGRLNLKKKGAPSQVSDEGLPWFKLPNRKNKEVKILFGHWASLECDVAGEPNVFAIDSGCVWGRSLTAFCLDDGRLISVKSRQKP